jgi:hypothetical protein
MMVLLASLLAASTALAETTTIDTAFDRMYRHQFEGAQQLVRDHLERHPQDPLGYGVRAAAYLFTELDRLHILEAEFFGDDKRILEKKKLTPDLSVRAAILDSIEKTRQKAAAALAQNSSDKNALIAMCIAVGVQTDYMALIEKRQFGSLSFARESQSWAVKLLAVDSTYYDAYLTAGVSEYLSGSVPFFIRWLLKFEKTEGSKAAAVRNLQVVAEKGRYLRPFAKVLLAIIHLREKRPAEAERQVAELHREFPENPLFKRELDKLVQRRR